jgi:hypothetical protein
MTIHGGPPSPDGFVAAPEDRDAAVLSARQAEPETAVRPHGGVLLPEEVGAEGVSVAGLLVHDFCLSGRPLADEEVVARRGRDAS